MCICVRLVCCLSCVYLHLCPLSVRQFTCQSECVCLSVYIDRQTWIYAPIGVTIHLPVCMCFVFSCISVPVYFPSSFVCLSVCVLVCVFVYLWVLSVGMSLTNKLTDRYIHRKANIHMQIGRQTYAHTHRDTETDQQTYR